MRIWYLCTLKSHIASITYSYFRDYCSLHFIILPKLDIGDQAMYNLRVIMQCLNQSTRMTSSLVVIVFGVELDFGHANNIMVVKAEEVDNMK